MSEHAPYVQLPVPEQYVLEVMQFLVDLDRGGGAGNGSGKREPSVLLDANLVMRMYEDSEERHRRLLHHLAEHPGEWIFTSELAKALGVETGTKGMAGVFGAFGRRAKHRYEGAKPWEMAWDPNRGEAKYRMDPAVAVWIEKVSHR